MNKKNQAWMSAAAVLLMGVSAAAMAQEATTASDAAAAVDADSPLHEGAYVAPLASYIISAGDGLLDNGFGGALLVGYRKGIWAMEGGGVGSRMSTKGKSATQLGGTINGLLFPMSQLPNLYGTLGVGGLEVQDYPHHNGSLSLTTFSGGAGYLWPLQFGNYEFAVRSEVLYRYGKRDTRINAERVDIDAPRSFDEILINIGLQLPMHKKAPPPPPPEPVKVVPTADADGDGVIDSLDQCPDTPAGTKVNASGCAVPLCKTPAAGERITLAGCTTGDTIVLSGVTFEFNQARLTPNAKTILDNVSDELKANPGIDVELSGHTDSIGADDYNQTLSQERAQSVREYLSKNGIDETRLTAVGYGESHPVADNETEEGRELNRRVELKVLANKAEAASVAAEASAAPASATAVPVEAVPAAATADPAVETPANDPAAAAAAQPVP